MNRRKKNSAYASALQITLALALLATSAVLFASTFRASAPAGSEVSSELKPQRLFNVPAPSLNAPIKLAPETAPFTFSYTGSLTTVRIDHTTTLLSNGLVLTAGGQTDNGFFAAASAELYNPATGTWSNTGSLITARAGHTATGTAKWQDSCRRRMGD